MSQATLFIIENDVNITPEITELLRRGGFSIATGADAQPAASSSAIRTLHVTLNEEAPSSADWRSGLQQLEGEFLAHLHNEIQNARVYFDQAADGFFLSDAQGYTIDVNPAGCAMLGYTREEILRLHLRDLIAPQNLATMLLQFDKLYLGSALVSECQLLRQDGSTIAVEISAKRLPDGAIQAIVRDTSERWRATEELRRSEEKFSTAFRVSPDAININRMSDGQYIEVNEGFLALSGYTAEEVIGKTSIELGIWVNAEDRQRLVRGLAECGQVNNLEALFRGKQGQVKVCLMSARILEIEGQPCILSITRDIDQNKRIEEENRRLHSELEKRVIERTAQLEAANKELEAFSYSVSHDLRAPLRILNGYSTALMEDCAAQLDPQGRHFLERIQEAAGRMGQLIDDLLNLSRINRSEFTREQVDISAMAGEIAARLHGQEPARQIEFVIASGLVVRGDAHLLRIALENLLSNAVKFTSLRTHSRIEVGVLQRESTRTFFVRDNGIGFNMEYANKLFSPFQRLHGMNEFPGTGIGLVIVQRIINRHGGRIWPEAVENEGVTFYFTLSDDV